MGFEKIIPIVKRIDGKWVNIADDAAKGFENGKVYIKMKSSVYSETLSKGVLEKAPITDTFVTTIPKGTKILPRVFPKIMNTGTTVLDDYANFKHYDSFFGEFTDAVNPLIMRRVKPISGKRVIHVSNFDRPNGTIAAASALSEPLFTDKIRSCASIAIVDKTQNLQSLIHCFPNQSTRSNEEIIKYILSHSNSKNLEISIIPGIMGDSGKSISFLVDMVKKYAREAKMNFLNFPRNKMGLSYGDERAILLQNGEVGFCKNFEVQNKIINPLEHICYCELL